MRHIEPKLVGTCPPDPLGLPDIVLLQTEELAVIDNLSGRLYLIVYADPAEPDAYAHAQQRLQVLAERLRAPVGVPTLEPAAPVAATHERTQADFMAAVEQAKALIQQGDFMQIVIGQRMHKPFAHPPLSLYRALRSLNPSPYMYYYNLAGADARGSDLHVIGASPRSEERRVGKECRL